MLEKHADFFRDFRGDTVHPSTMEILDQLGMLERFLKRPHNEVDAPQLRMAGREWTIGDLSHLDTPAPFIAMMPQWDFLDFLREEAKAFPAFTCEMEAPVDGFIEEQGRVAGVRLADGRGAARAADHRRRRAHVDRPRRCFRSRRSARRWTCSGSAIPKTPARAGRAARQCRARARCS